jgi:hypothetical protein
MQSSFREAVPGKALIQNVSAMGTERLAVSLHPGNQKSVEIEINEESTGSDLVSSSIIVTQDSLQQLVEWLRAQGIVT